MVKMDGYFFALEGIDGAGKSSIIPLVKRSLTGSGYKVWVTAEPTPLISDLVKIREFPYDPQAMFLLFTFDRKMHQEIIKGWLDKGYIVITDRYIASSLAYQGAGISKVTGDRKGAFGWMESVSRVITVRPDLTFYLSVDPSIAMERLKDSRMEDKMEQAVDQREIAGLYDEILQDVAVRIDASRPIDEVADRVATKIRDFMARH